MSVYVAAYDISDHRRRRQVARFLLRYGPRVQESVFETWIEAEELAEFRFQLGLLLAPEDAFDLFPIAARAAGRRYRWQRPPTEWSPVLLL